MTDEIWVEPAESPPPHSPRQVLLGLFILFQLAFLFLSNGLGFLKSIPTEKPDKAPELINRLVPHFAQQQGHAWQWVEQVDYLLQAWAQLTGQDQEWSLFAPAVSKGTAFPCVVLSWQEPSDDDPGIQGARFAYDPDAGFHLLAECNALQREPSLRSSCALAVLAAQNPWEAAAMHARCRMLSEAPPRVRLLLSENEPRDVLSYFRVGNCRLRRYEGTFYFSPQPLRGESRLGTEWRVGAKINELFHSYRPMMRVYLSWRLKAWQREHPDEPAPKQVLLCERFFRIRIPSEPPGWDGPYLIPLARWLPALDQPEGPIVLEPYDLSQRRFVASP